MGMNVSIEGSNPSFSAPLRARASRGRASSGTPPRYHTSAAEGWQSGRMRRSRKPLSVVRRIEGSNPSPSVSPEKSRSLQMLVLAFEPWRGIAIRACRCLERSSIAVGELTRRDRGARGGSATSREAPQPSARPRRAYDAFISYSRTADGRLGPALQRGLQRFAKPWYRLRALRVFRDDASLSANPDLWGSIQQALDDSEYFVLLASPAAAESPWVGKEAEYWLEHRGTERMLLVLTEGDLFWTASGVDRVRTSALPAPLDDAFAEEPRYVDLRWARTDSQLDRRDARFRDALADLAAPLHGRSKDEMLGEDVRQHKRTLAVAWSAAAMLALLAIGASVLAVLAVQARD